MNNNNKGKFKKKSIFYETFSKNDKEKREGLEKDTMPLVLVDGINEGHEIAHAEELRDEPGGSLEHQDSRSIEGMS